MRRLCHDDEQHTSACMHDDCGHRRTCGILLLISFFCWVAGVLFMIFCALPIPSHIADNDIGDAGCIALSSSLVHLSHLEVLNLFSKFIVWSGAFVVILVFGADFVVLIFGMRI